MIQMLIFIFHADAKLEINCFVWVSAQDREWLEGERHMKDMSPLENILGERDVGMHKQVSSRIVMK